MEMEEVNQEQNLETSVTKPKPNSKNFAVKAVIYIVLIVVVAIAVVGIGMFRFGWKGPVVSAFQTVVPYPVAVVEGRLVTKSEFDDRYSAFKQSVQANQQFDFEDPANIEIVAEQKQSLLNRLIEIELEEILARRMGISVSDEDVERELDALKQQTNLPQTELETLVSNMYGWTIPQFKKAVLVPQIREQKLQQALTNDFTLNKDAYQKILDVQGRLDAGEDFTAVAQEVSQDTQSAPLGGDLGWAPRGLYVQEFEDAAFSLEEGARSDIIVTSFGYHIAEMLEKGTDEESGAEQFHIRHILIVSMDFYEWLDEQKEDASIWKVENI